MGGPDLSPGFDQSRGFVCAQGAVQRSTIGSAAPFWDNSPTPFRQVTGVALARAAGEEACVWGAYHGQSRHGCRAVFFHARIRYSGCDRRCEVVHLTKNRLSHRPARDRERSRGTSAPRPLPPAADITAKMLTAALAE